MLAAVALGSGISQVLVSGHRETGPRCGLLINGVQAVMGSREARSAAFRGVNGLTSTAILCLRSARRREAVFSRPLQVSGKRRSESFGKKADGFVDT